MRNFLLSHTHTLSACSVRGEKGGGNEGKFFLFFFWKRKERGGKKERKEKKGGRGKEKREAVGANGIKERPVRDINSELKKRHCHDLGISRSPDRTRRGTRSRKNKQIIILSLPEMAWGACVDRFVFSIEGWGEQYMLTSSAHAPPGRRRLLLEQLERIPTPAVSFFPPSPGVRPLSQFGGRRFFPPELGEMNLSVANRSWRLTRYVRPAVPKALGAAMSIRLL